MEYEDLKTLWEKYDSKLDNLEKLNKKLMKETLLRKPVRKINWHKFNSLYGVIMIPVILAGALHSYFTKENMNWELLAGCTLALLVVIYLEYIYLKSYFILRKIDLSNDSVIESTNKVVEFKKMFNNLWKHSLFFYPALVMGVLLISWHSITFNTKTIISIIVFFIVTYIINIFKSRTYRNKIAKLEKDILDLKEYTE